jgi:cytochrome c
MIKSVLSADALRPPVSSGLTLPETQGGGYAITSMEVPTTSYKDAPRRPSACPSRFDQEAAKEMNLEDNRDFGSPRRLTAPRPPTDSTRRTVHILTVTQLWAMALYSEAVATTRHPRTAVQVENARDEDDRVPDPWTGRSMRRRYRRLIGSWSGRSPALSVPISWRPRRPPLGAPLPDRNRGRAAHRSRTAASAILAACLVASSAPPLGAIAAAPPGAADFSSHCAGCHSTEPGANRIGPSLAGVDGRTSGTVPGYTYSSALKSAKIVWSDAMLNKFLQNPSGLVPGTKMFMSVPNAAMRQQIVAYLQSQKAQAATGK